MPAQEPQELICITCWQGFRLADARRLDDGTVVCPHCGSAQPGAESLDAEAAQAPAAPPPPQASEAPPGESASPETAVEASSAQGGTSAPDASPPVPAAEGAASEASTTATAGAATAGEQDAAAGSAAAEATAPAEAEQDLEAQVLALDPQRATWRVKTGLGFSYTFYGIDAVVRWTQGKDVSGAGIAPQGIDLWKNLDHFLRKLDRLEDARQALLAAVPMGETPPPDDDVWLRRRKRSRGRAPLEGASVELVGSPPTPRERSKDSPAAEREETAAPAGAGAPAKKTKGGPGVPSTGRNRSKTPPAPSPARTTRRFEFRKPEPPPPKMGRAGPFLLGLLLGTLAGLGLGALALWYAGLWGTFLEQFSGF